MCYYKIMTSIKIKTFTNLNKKDLINKINKINNSNNSNNKYKMQIIKIISNKIKNLKIIIKSVNILF